MKKTTLLLVSALLMSVAPALASETTGTLTTGIDAGGVEGVVVTAPIASPVAGTYSSTQSVTLTASGSSSIRYTTDGSTPTCSTGTAYSSAISVSSSATIKAISCYPNNNESSVASFGYTIRSSGGGGGSAPPATTPTTTVTPTKPISEMTIAELQTELNRLIALLAQLRAATGVPSTPTGTSACPYTWTRTLDIGSTGADVLQLQKFLNSSADTVLSAVPGAPGSLGYETSYYGSITGAAVSKFQTKYFSEILTPIGLTAPTTKFGAMSRAKANALCK